MSDLDWPDAVRPYRQTLYLKTSTIQFKEAPTGQIEVGLRADAIWTASLLFKLPRNKSRQMDALLARLRGSSGIAHVPDFRNPDARIGARSMDDYAEEIGTTFFNDRYDFDDESFDDGGLAFEESLPLGLEEELSLGDYFDALLLFGLESDAFNPDNDVILLTETNDEIWAENQLISFTLENGKLLTTEYHAELDIGCEEGVAIEAENYDPLVVQIGGGFFEGEGQPTLVSGSHDTLLIKGCAPFESDIVWIGERIQTSPGRAHIVIGNTTTDLNGKARIKIAPLLRESVALQSLSMDAVKIRMRLVGDDNARNETLPDGFSFYNLQFEEVI